LRSQSIAADPSASDSAGAGRGTATLDEPTEADSVAGAVTAVGAGAFVGIGSATRVAGGCATGAAGGATDAGGGMADAGDGVTDAGGDATGAGFDATGAGAGGRAGLTAEAGGATAGRVVDVAGAAAGGAEATGAGVLAGAGLAGAEGAFVSLDVPLLAGWSPVGLLVGDAGAASLPFGDAASASPAVTWMDVAYRVLSRTS
jgi:hypothetical protein